MEQSNKRMSDEFLALSKAIQIANDTLYNQQKQKRISGYKTTQEFEEKLLNEKTALQNLIQQSEFTPKYKELLLTSTKDLGNVENIPLGLEALPTTTSVLNETEKSTNEVEEVYNEIEELINDLQTGNYNLQQLLDTQAVLQDDLQKAETADTIENINILLNLTTTLLDERLGEAEEEEEGDEAKLGDFETATKSQLLSLANQVYKSSYYKTLNKASLVKVLKYYEANPELTDNERKAYIQAEVEIVKASRMGRRLPAPPLGVGVQEGEASPRQRRVRQRVAIAGEGLSKKQKLKINLGSIQNGNDNKKLLKRTTNMMKLIK